MAGKIPQDFIDEVVSRTDIVELINARVPLKRAGKEYKACCPFHEERTPSFTVSSAKQFYHCFGCGAHGTAIGFLMEYDNMEFPEAVEHLAGRLGLEIPKASGGEPRGTGDGTQNLLRVLEKADAYYRTQLRRHAESKTAIEYLKRRGLTGEIAARFGLGYAPPGWDNLLKALGHTPAEREALIRAGLAVKKDAKVYDRFRNRIIFPIHDHRGRVVGFGGRVLDDGEPKYLNSPETPLFHKGSELYGLHAARSALPDDRSMVVVEGYMDVLALAQFGVENAVATLGTATTRRHLERLFRYCSDVVFCFDGDDAGKRAAWRALETALPALEDGRQIGFLFLPEGHDPDTLIRAEGRETFIRRMRAAVPLPDFLFRHLVDQVNLKRLDGRARLIELAKPLLRQIPPCFLRNLILDRLAEIAHSDRDSLSEAIFGPPGPAPKGRPSGRLPPGPTSTPPSLMRTALALLVQHPRLARIAGEVVELEGLELPGMELLAAAVNAITHHPGMTTAALLERFRDTDDGKHLEKLAIWDHLIADEQLEEEFRSLIAKLKRQLRDQHTDSLLAKARSAELTSEEKTALRELLRRSD